jgi:hypothetical protein
MELISHWFETGFYHLFVGLLGSASIFACILLAGFTIAILLWAVRGVYRQWRYERETSKEMMDDRFTLRQWAVTLTALIGSIVVVWVLLGLTFLAPYPIVFVLTTPVLGIGWLFAWKHILIRKSG